MLPQVVTFPKKLGEKGLIRKLLKLSKCSELNSMGQGFHTKLNHSQLPMLKKRRLEENAFMFLRKVFIRLQKESSSLPRQLHSNCHCSCRLHLKIEYLCPQSQGELELKCHMIKELAWDTSSTENFWLDVYSYKEPVGNFPFQLFSLGVLKMFGLPILNADSKWCIRPNKSWDLKEKL